MITWLLERISRRLFPLGWGGVLHYDHGPGQKGRFTRVDGVIITFEGWLFWLHLLTQRIGRTLTNGRVGLIFDLTCVSGQLLGNN